MQRLQGDHHGTGRTSGRGSTVLLVAGLVAVLVVPLALFVSLGHAADAPHWLGALENTDCTSNCHVPHQALGGGLNPQTGNTNLCQSCHNSNNLPIDSNHRAIPGLTGTSHAFDVNPVKADYGALAPENQEMLLRLMEGNVVCSTCHNQHSAEAAMGGTPRISATSKVVDGGGTGTVASQGTFNGAQGVWYLLEIDGAGDQSSATFRWSKDNGTSWMVSGVSAGNSLPVALDSGVEVVFTGGGAAFLVGERWEFYGSYPFLRVALDAGDINAVDTFCRDCHRDWVMTHDSDLIAGGGVETWDGNFKSHPVGVGLNANLQDYDRTQPLDGNGLAQAAGSAPDVDGNPTNDLKLDASGNVQCLSCHGVHYADSNTLTVDGP